MVFFKDKAGSQYSVSNPLGYLSPKAIARRIQRGAPVTELDIPVNVNYIQDVKNTGADVYFSTRWMNGLLIQCSPATLSSIQALSFVERIELVAPNAKLIPNGRKKGNLKNKRTKADATEKQLQMLGIDRMHQDGKRGEGVTIAVFDSGFEGVNVTSPFQHLFDQNRIDLTLSHDYVFNSDDIFQYDDHGTEVFSVIAAFVPGTFSGGAYEASFQLYVTEDVSTEYRIEEYNWLFAAERADSAGVDIITSSLGYYDFDNDAMDYPKTAMDGKTTVVTRAAQLAADRGIVVIVSAGNEGGIPWQIITAPADARDVLGVASVNDAGTRLNSSSIGPSADNRIKPDVAALGSGTRVIRADGSLGSSSGTSLATPLITSLAAGVWQEFPELTNIELINAIRKSASQSWNPDYLLGYGIPNYTAVLNYMNVVAQQNLFEVGPNPFSNDTLIVSPRNPDEITGCRIELLSVQGQSVFSADAKFSWQHPRFEANLSNLASGVYFMRIAWGARMFTYKLIKN